MRIGGLQKMTLLDYPGKVACTVFLSGCNLRCPFCHNAGLVLPDKMEGEISRQELLDFLSRRRGKLDGVCITGGEPTIWQDLPQLMEEIRSMGFLLKLDTNGSNPQMVQELLDRDLIQYAAMDIKNCPEDYEKTCGGVDILQAVTRTRDLLMNSTIDYEFRTTVCSPLHTVDGIRKLAQWIRGAKRYYLQNFVDSGNLVGEGIHACSSQELEAMARAAREFIPHTQLRGI